VSANGLPDEASDGIDGGCRQVDGTSYKANESGECVATDGSIQEDS